MSRSLSEPTLEALAAAVQRIPVHPEAAWPAVWARLRSAPAQRLARWPLAMSMSVLLAVLMVGNLGVFRPLALRTFTAVYLPRPAVMAATPTPVARHFPAEAATLSAPAATNLTGPGASGPAPAPLPPDQS
jgi:hypothetical protein